MNIALLTGLAFAPGIYLAIVIYGKDRYDREPKRILFIAFLLGALSTLPAAGIELLLEQTFGLHTGSFTGAAIQAFLGVALVEELCKFGMLRMHAYRLKEFNEPFDGIVYASFVALGFATLENLLYVLEGGWGVGVARMFTAVPAHYAFGVVMGYYVGKAKFEHRTNGNMLYAILTPTLLHGAYDFFIMQQSFPVLAVFTFITLLWALRLSQKSIRELHADSKFRFHAIQHADANAPHEPHEQNG